MIVIQSVSQRARASGRRSESLIGERSQGEEDGEGGMKSEDGGGCGNAMRLSVSHRRFNAPERRFSATLSAALITTSIMMDGWG